MRKPMMIFITLLLFVSTACATFTERKSTGIPVTSSQGFFYNMKQVSLESGYDVSENETTLTVHVGKWASLQYGPGYDGDSIDVVAFVKNKGKESDASKQERAQKVMQIHEELLAKARKLAKTNEMFR